MKSTKFNDSLFNKERLHIDFGEFNISNARGMGRLNYSKAHYPLDMHAHLNTMEICYIAKGRQIYVVDGREYHIFGGDVYITRPNELHGSGTYPEEKSILYWLFIDLTNTRNFLDYPPGEGKELLAGLLAIKKRCFRGNSHLRELLDRIILACHKNEAYTKIIVRNLITEFIIAIIELEKEGHCYAYSPEISSILNNIDLGVPIDDDLSELASRARLSVSRFKQKFKEEVGIPPKEYMIRKKVERAAELLENTSMSITDIAFELSFSSSQYFSTVFKRITGKSPTDIRTEKQGNLNAD